MRTRARPDKQVLRLEERWESERGAFATRPGSQVDNVTRFTNWAEKPRRFRTGIYGDIRGYKALLIARLHGPKVLSVQKTYGRAAQK